MTRGSAARSIAGFRGRSARIEKIIIRARKFLLRGIAGVDLGAAVHESGHRPSSRQKPKNRISSLGYGTNTPAIHRHKRVQFFRSAWANHTTTEIVPGPGGLSAQLKWPIVESDRKTTTLNLIWELWGKIVPSMAGQRRSHTSGLPARIAANRKLFVLGFTPPRSVHGPSASGRAIKQGRVLGRLTAVRVQPTSSVRSNLGKRASGPASVRSAWHRPAALYAGLAAERAPA